MKKIVVILALTIALSTTLYFYFSKKKIQSNQTELYMAIPANFPIAFETGNWEVYYNKLDTLPVAKNIKEKDWYVGAKVNYGLSSKLRSYFLEATETPTLIALGNNGNEGIGIVTVSSLNISNTQFEEKLTEIGIQWTTYSSQNNLIYTIKDFEDKYTVYCAIKSGFYVFSFKSNFVEEALLAVEKKSNQFEKKDINSNFVLYIKPQQLNFLSNYILNPQYFEIGNSLQTLIHNTVLNVDFFNNEIVFYGNSNYSKTMHLDTIKKLNIETDGNINFLPDNVCYYQSVNFKDTMLHTGDYLKNSFYDQITQSYTIFIQNTYDTNINGNKGIVVKIQNEEDIANVIKEIDANTLLAEDNIYSSKIGTFISENLLLKTPIDNSVYWTILSNRLIVSSNISVVKNFVQKYKDNKVLKLNESYASFRNNLLTQSNIDVFIDFKELQTYTNATLSASAAFLNLSKFSMQLSNFGSMVNVQGKISFNNITEIATPKELWTTTLSHTASSMPFQTIDFNTQANEILLQDDSNNLYQISKAGEIQFKIPIKEKIKSEIFQIDYYSNNKLQYVFNTENKIYVVDRTGALVDGFPIELPEGASNAMLMTQYADNNNVRYFVACKNENIYGYEINGKPLSSWSPLKNAGEITTPVNRVVVEGKDFIYYTDTKGTLTALSRNGDKRFKKVKTNAINSFTYQNNNFVAGSNGKVYIVDLKGNVTEKLILDESYTHFKYVKSINENKEAYAFANNNTFKLQLSQWKNLCTFKVDDTIRKIDALVYQNKLWFLIYTNTQVFMIDEIANLHPEFPLNTKNDIGIYNLIDGKEKVIVYTNGKELIVKEIKWTNL